MSKLLRILFLTLMVVVFPLISWFYLRGGIDFRKTALQDIEPIANLDSINFPVFELIPGGKDDFVSPYYVIVHINSYNRSLDTALAGISLQLGQVPSVVLMAIGDTTAIQYEFPNSWVQLSENDHLAQKFISACAGLANHANRNNVYLIDDQRHLRHFYALEDRQQMKDFAVHAGVLLPIKNHKELEFKRKIEY